MFHLEKLYTKKKRLVSWLQKVVAESSEVIFIRSLWGHFGLILVYIKHAPRLYPKMKLLVPLFWKIGSWGFPKNILTVKIWRWPFLIVESPQWQFVRVNKFQTLTWQGSARQGFSKISKTSQEELKVPLSLPSSVMLHPPLKTTSPPYTVENFNF